MPAGYPALKNATSTKNRIRRIATRTQQTLLPLVAVGGSLAGLPASALELGDLTVQSKLGQPLRASIAYALAPNEELADSCVTLGTGAAASGLPGIGRASISVADGSILLSGKTPVREPMLAAQVVVNCPYTANLSREYMLFIDPAGPVFDQQPVVEAPSAAPAAPLRRATAVAPTRRAPAASTANREPIGKATRYRVQRGDSLSQIAQRIENRSIRLWPAVNAIFDANPDAFIDNDPNKLKAGSWLTIPSFDGSEAVVSAAAPSASPIAESVSVTPTSPVSSDFEASLTEASAAAESAPTETSVAIPVDIQEPLSDATRDLRPGDVIIDSDNPFVDAGGAANDSIVIPDTELEGPTTSSSSPNVPTAVINTSTQKSTSSWLMWLAGGFALLIGLLLFGRRFSATRIGPASDKPMRRATDEGTQNIEAIGSTGFDLDDDSPTEENLILDADLVVGTGLQEGTDMDVSQDFGFAAPTEVDIELPFEPEATISSDDTDIISPSHTDAQTILDSEILPEDDDYDMSVIIDATKMPVAEDITERDLKAIEISPVDADAKTDAYTISNDVDFDILEQDYEEELTATQALNVEIESAAMAIARTMDKDDATVEMPRATVTEIDVTAQLPARDEDDSDLDDDDNGDTGAVTVNLVADDKTAEMPAAENDDTTEMEIEGGKIDTKAV